MQTLQALIEGIVNELTKLQTLPAVHRDKHDDFRLPRLIDAGHGRSITVSRTIDECISTVADQLMAGDATLAPRYTRAEWRTAVRRAFGLALARIDLDESPGTNAGTVLADVKSALGKHVSSHGGREFMFGCTLFGNANVQPFAIGPVRFESRLQWLARKHSEGGVSTVTRRRIERAWSGTRLSKRMPSEDSARETDILSTVGACAFVCSVATDGLGAEAGREKALTAARLAIVAIALLWQTPSKALEGLNLLFDRSPHRRRFMTFIPGKGVGVASRWSHMPHGPWLEDGEWEKTFLREGDHFAIVADVLAYVVTPSGKVARPRMMNALTQAVLGFHEGCREAVTLMAIVKFAAALDALACGGKSGGIRRLVNARLDIADNAPIRPDGPTLKQVVEEIYGDARSRTIHGTNDKLGHDWTQTRALAEQLGRLCLLVCIDWVAKNPSSDDPSQLSR